MKQHYVNDSATADWLKFCADDETGQLDPEPHQADGSEVDPTLPSLLRRQAA